MTLDVISFGVGRTGTLSMKMALEQLGFGRCHHMEEVDIRSGPLLAAWIAAARGAANWRELYAGYRSAVDWPTAAFCPELTEAFPNAKFILTVRDPERWAESFSNTIMNLVQPTDETPPELLPFLDMVVAVVEKTGFRIPSDKDALVRAFNRHIAKVKSIVPADRLLVFDVRQGWEPLCGFLGVPVPSTAFPRTNSSQDFQTNMERDIALITS